MLLIIKFENDTKINTYNLNWEMYLLYYAQESTRIEKSS